MHKSQEDKLKKQIGIRIKELRMARCSKVQKEFSKTMGIGQPQISRIERGKNISIGVLFQLMQATIDNKKINMNWLITGRGEPLLGNEFNDKDIDHKAFKTISKLDLKRKKALLDLLE